jgi:hypothetical protein
MSRSAITVVHSNRAFPTKQYQCGKKFVESKARELSQTAAVANVSVSNPSLTV